MPKANGSKIKKTLQDIELEKAQAELDEWNSPEAKAQRQAERRQATANADKAVADARRSQISAMIPDLSGVETGTLDVKGDVPLFGGVLAHHALGEAVKKIDDAVRRVAMPGTILITTDQDLATGDAVYLQTSASLAMLTYRVNEMLQPQAESEGGGLDRHLIPAGPAPALLGAAASALPALISLMSANRSVQAFAGTGDALAAAVAIAAALRNNSKTSVWLDDLRLVENAAVLTAAAELDRRRASLAELAKDPKTNPGAQQLLDEVNAFLMSIHTSPPGKTRSPIVTAALYERLHNRAIGDVTPPSVESPKFSHVLWVQGSTSSTQQVVDDRPFLFNDKVAVLGTVSIPWALIDTTNSAVSAAGVAVGTVQLTGQIGGRFTIESVRTTSTGA